MSVGVVDGESYQSTGLGDINRGNRGNRGSIGTGGEQFQQQRWIDGTCLARKMTVFGGKQRRQRMIGGGGRSGRVGKGGSGCATATGVFGVFFQVFPFFDPCQDVEITDVHVHPLAPFSDGGTVTVGLAGAATEHRR